MKIYKINIEDQEIITARHKLVEKSIDWKETYTDKTFFLKEQYEDIIGSGSYFRFEGTDSASGDSYYCIIGPAKVHKPRAKFFAGVRKLPATYSAGGKEFDSMDAAARYATETWGVPRPKSLKPYTSASLYGLGAKVDKWKAKRDREEDRENKKEEREREKGKQKDKKVKKPQDTNIESSGVILGKSENILIEAMSKPQVFRKQYKWWNAQDLFNYQDADPSDIPPNIMPQIRAWNQVRKESPSDAQVALEETKAWQQSTDGKLAAEYNMDSEELSKVVRAYVGYDPNYGFYILAVGPYLPSEKAKKYIVQSQGEEELEKRMDRFGYYVYKPSSKTMDQFVEGAYEAADKYNKAFGINLDPSDFKIQFPKLSGSTFLNEGSENEDGGQLSIDSLDWYPSLPYPSELLSKFNSLSKKLKGQYKEGEAKSVALNMLANYYKTDATHMSDMINKGSQAISNMDKNKIDLANADREQKNATLNPEAYEFNQSSPMVRRGTMVTPNNQGAMKLALHYVQSQGLEQYVDEAVKRAIVSNRNIKEAYGTPEALKELFGKDYEATRRIYKFMRDIYNLDPNNANPILDWSSMRKLNVKKGSQNFTALPVDTGQARETLLRKEIVDALGSGARTIRDIQNKLSESDKRVREISRQEKGIGQANPQVEYNYIREQLGEIKKMASDRGISNYQDLSVELQEMYSDLVNHRGFEDMQTAMDMAGMHYTNFGVDPATRAKYSTEAKKGQLLFRPEEDFQNFTRDDIRNKRIEGVLTDPRKTEVEKPGQIDEVVDEMEEQDEDVSEDISTLETLPKTPSVDISEKNEEKQGIIEKNKEQLSKEEPVPNMSQVQKIDRPDKVSNVFRNTITNLIKIAKELDDENKGNASEEIHKVIRRYQGRIR